MASPPPMRAATVYLGPTLFSAAPVINGLVDTNPTANQSTIIPVTNSSGGNKVFVPMQRVVRNSDVRTVWQGRGWAYVHPGDIRPTDARGRALIRAGTVQTVVAGELENTSGGTPNPLSNATFQIAFSVWRWDIVTNTPTLIGFVTGSTISISGANLTVGAQPWSATISGAFPSDVLLERDETLVLQYGCIGMSYPAGTLGGATAADLKLQLNGARFVYQAATPPREWVTEDADGVQVQDGLTVPLQRRTSPAVQVQTGVGERQLTAVRAAAAVQVQTGVEVSRVSVPPPAVQVQSGAAQLDVAVAAPAVQVQSGEAAVAVGVAADGVQVQSGDGVPQLTVSRAADGVQVQSGESVPVVTYVRLAEAVQVQTLDVYLRVPYDSLPTGGGGGGDTLVMFMLTDD